MGEMFALGLIVTAVAGLLAVPIFYIWALAAGPAVKHLGRKWKEGALGAYHAHEVARQAVWQQGFNEGQAARIVPPGTGASGTAAPASAGGPAKMQYTITGKPIR